MSATVLAAVLAAALLHATWNALIKVQGDSLMAIAIMSMGSGAVGICMLPFVAFPSAEVWLWLIISAIFHIGYRVFLVTAYAHGDLSQVYPLARGTAPLLVTLSSFLLIGETVSLTQALGMAAIICAWARPWAVTMPGRLNRSNSAW